MFLGKTQKQEILSELKLLVRRGFNHLGKTIEDIEINGKESQYLCFTDVDNQQIGIKVSDDIWVYSQQNKLHYDWNIHNELDVEEYKTETMEFSDYTDVELDEMVSAFYDGIKELKDNCGVDWKQITLECIFETYE